MRQPVQVAVYCVRNTPRSREYLLLKRIPRGGGNWQGITGGVENDEEYYTAALRELKEETGFEPEKIEMIDFTYTFPVEEDMRKLYDHPVDLITEIIFIAHIKNGLDPILDPEEHDAFQWCDCRTALDKLHWPGNKAALHACEKRLNQ